VAAGAKRLDNSSLTIATLLNRIHRDSGHSAMNDFQFIAICGLIGFIIGQLNEITKKLK
jgi:hypothetical protein